MISYPNDLIKRDTPIPTAEAEGLPSMREILDRDTSALCELIEKTGELIAYILGGQPDSLPTNSDVRSLQDNVFCNHDLLSILEQNIAILHKGVMR